MGLFEGFGVDADDNSSYAPEQNSQETEVIEGGAGDDKLAPPKIDPRTDDLSAAIIMAAKKIGVNPVDLATAISYETGGTFDPWKAGPTTQWGQHRGLIQWGEPQAKQYGVYKGMSNADQMDAVAAYLVDRGVKPGMGLLDVYSAINAGGVGLYNRSDAGNGGAPGTVRDKVEGQMAGHRIKAAMLLGQDGAVPEGMTRAAPVQDAIPYVGRNSTMPPEVVKAMGTDSVVVPPVVDPHMGIDLANTASNISVDPNQPAITLQDPQKLKVAPLVAPIVPISMPELAPVDPNAPATVLGPAKAPPKSFLEMLQGAGKDTLEGAKQFVAKGVGATTSLPLKLGAAVSAIPSLVGSDMGKDTAVALMDEARKMEEGGDFMMGVPKEGDTPFQKTAALVGRNAQPLGPSKAAVTGLMAGGELLSDALRPTAAVAGAGLTKDEANNVLGGPSPQQNALLPGPRVTHTMQTAGGPAQIPEADMKLMGIMGAVTLGAIFVPSVVSKMKDTALGSRMFGLDARAVEHAPTGVLAFSDRIDLMRTYDDKYAGVLRMADRMGVNPKVLNDIQDTFQIQTGGAARNLVNSAVTSGEMQTPLFTFKAKVPVAELGKLETGNPAISDYMHTRNTLDDIMTTEAKLSRTSQANQATQASYGPVTVRGLTGPDALARINALEAADPALKDFSKAYMDNVYQMRKFLNNGEYGTLSKAEFQELNQTGRNTVYQKLAKENDQTLPASPSGTLEAEMQKSMRHRMENEAKGMYIDGMRKQNPAFSKVVTAEELEKNSNWKPNTVKIYRRGKPEYHVMDPFVADVLNMDPYMSAGTISSGMYVAKRVMETTATGIAAPWFASTSALRSWQIGKITTGEGLRPPTIWGMTKAVPEQLYPQVAKALGETLDRGSSGWLGTVFGPQVMHGMSQQLAKAYDNSFYAMMEKAGTHQGSFLQHHAELDNSLTKAIGSVVPGPAKSFLHGYKQFLNSIHNSASFDYAQKNVDKLNLPQLAASARHLTGDPTQSGQFFKDGRKAIRFQDEGSRFFGADVPAVVSHTATKAAQGYGLLTEVGREMVPWWNITTQGMKRIGESYLDNPAKFVGKTYLYQSLPAASLFLYSRGLGDDPNGRSYSDYQMNRRSEYAKLMNWYIPIPGRPAEDGIEVPRFHELAPVAHMMEVALNHLTQSSIWKNTDDYMKSAFSLIGVDYAPHSDEGALFSNSEDAAAVGKSFFEAAIAPPTPPAANALLATQGIIMPQGVFGGEAYKKRTDPYDQFSGMNTSFELVARALGTGLADVIGEGYNAYTRSEDGLSGAKAAATASTRKVVEKTPILRDVIGWKAPASGNTRIAEEMFNNQKAIDQLARFYKKNDESMDDQGISGKARSISGGKVAEQLLGKGPPESVAAQGQPDPTNPLYSMFIKEVYDKFRTDSLKNERTGEVKPGIGYQSLMQRYGQYSANLKALKNVNEGNSVAWDHYLATVPDQMQYLVDNKVDPTDVRTVRNFYEAKRQDAARQILFTVRAVEEEFSRRLGQPIKLKDLDPYGKGAGVSPLPVVGSQAQ